MFVTLYDLINIVISLQVYKTFFLRKSKEKDTKTGKKICPFSPGRGICVYIPE